MLLFFCLVMLPMMTFVGVFAIEYQRFLGAQRNAELLAEAAANAAVVELLPNDPNFPERASDSIDETSARAAVAAVVDAFEAGSGRDGGTWIADINATTTVVQRSGTTPSNVTVAVQWRIPSAGFSQLAMSLFGLQDVLQGGTGSATAYVCIPGQGATYDGSCVEYR